MRLYFSNAPCFTCERPQAWREARGSYLILFFSVRHVVTWLATDYGLGKRVIVTKRKLGYKLGLIGCITRDTWVDFCSLLCSHWSDGADLLELYTTACTYGYGPRYFVSYMARYSNKNLISFRWLALACQFVAATRFRHATRHARGHKVGLLPGPDHTPQCVSLPAKIKPQVY